MCLISAGRAGLVVEGSPAFWFGAPGPPGEQKRPDAREGPAWAGHEPGIRFRMGAGALHGYHITTFEWERNYKRSRSPARPSRNLNDDGPGKRRSGEASGE